MQKIVPKTGIFIFDQGKRLARSIDLDVVIQRLVRIKNVTRCEVLTDLAAPLPSIKEDFTSDKFNRILWVGKFSDYQKKTIQSELSSAGLNPYMYEWCDLEEQGIGTKGVDSGIQTQKAIILIQMTLARTRLLEPLEPLELPAVDASLIIGAGVSGLHTATSLIGLGKKVYLAEKESGVGGKVASLHRLYPRICDPRCGLEFEIQKIRESDMIEVHTLSRVKSLFGSPGNFDVRIEKQPRYVSEEKCNACGECMKVCPAVIPEEQRSRESAFINETSQQVLNSLKSDKKAIHPAVPMTYPSTFVIERQYCPPDCRECVKACPALAVELEQTSSELAFKVGAVIITTGWDPYQLSKVDEYGYGIYPNVISNLEMERLLEDPPVLKEIGFIQCAGSRDERHLNYCSSVCCSVSLKQVLFLKEKLPDTLCYIFYQDMRTPGFDEELYQKVKSLNKVIFIRGNPSTVKPGDNGKLRIHAEDTLSGKEIDLSLDLLVLAGGMMPSQGSFEIAQLLNLPQNNFGFFESHLQCHPEESQRTGILVGGACRGPMNISQSIESSHRAAMEVLPFLNRTILIEPKYPVLDLTKCDKCKRCMEECPFLSYVFDENGFPSLDLTKCRQCGNCMGICPLIAISLRNNTIKQIAAQVQAIKPSFISKEEPVILAFLCENDAYHAAQSAVEYGLPVPPNVFFIKVPCAGSVNNALVADALAFGIDGVLIAGCKDGQCHYVKGNQLVKTRSGDLSDKLQKMMIDPQRVRFESLEIRDSKKYVELVKSYIEELRATGPNPFKS
ncbi:MAG: hydrogenase iron-sulfur subunit [Nitrospirae bacterium]|nr:hydrogenase iron-sulfur subunit [Nitrospirota bacterium]